MKENKILRVLELSKRFIPAISIYVGWGLIAISIFVVVPIAFGYKPSVEDNTSVSSKNDTAVSVSQTTNDYELKDVLPGAIIVSGLGGVLLYFGYKTKKKYKNLPNSQNLVIRESDVSTLDPEVSNDDEISNINENKVSSGSMDISRDSFGSTKNHEEEVNTEANFRDSATLQRMSGLVTRTVDKVSERIQAEREKRDQYGYMRRGQWYPPKPSGAVVTPWFRGDEVEVVGEKYRGDAFRRIMANKPKFNTYSGTEAYLDAFLVPDPHNPFGEGKAVAVYVEGEHVGYLAQEDANLYYPELEKISSVGNLLKVPARIWASCYNRETVHARVTLKLPIPRAIKPSNNFPDTPYVVIPEGRNVQATRENEYMHALIKYVLPGVDEDNYVVAHSLQVEFCLAAHMSLYKLRLMVSAWEC